MMLFDGTRVRVTQGIREISTGDTGTVTSRWTRPLVAIRWDKDNKVRLINRRRLEIES